MDKPTVLKRVIMTLLTVLVIVYVIYVICRASFTQVKTMTAKENIAYNAITADAFVIHDEALVRYDGDGIISYVVGDGEKVSINEPVAGVFDSVASAGTKQAAERLKSKINALTMLQANSDAITRTPDELDNEIEGSLIKANTGINSGDLSSARNSADDILYAINERQLVTGKSKNYNDKLGEMKEEYQAISSKLSEGKMNKEIKAPCTGYFVSGADGYENLIKTGGLEELMPADMTEDKLVPADIPDNVIGKTVSGVYWYIACPVSAEDAIKIKNAGSIKLDIPIVSSEKIKAELYSLNQPTRTSDAVVVLRGTFMNAEMAGLRKANISIILNTYEGIRIPKSAVHEREVTRVVEDENGNEQEETKVLSGCYVKIGNEVAFREVIPVYSGEDYIISAVNVSKDKMFSEKVGIVQVYDEIITEGANLYDGKIINRTN